MKKEFALDPHGPKRLKVTYSARLENAEVLLDGLKIAAFPTKAEFLRGTTLKLPDGSMLTVKYGPVEGVRIIKGVHLIRNGTPIPGSAADPVPGWAWIFMVACALIPVISLGGALPALLAGGGVAGTMFFSRFSRWSVGLRVAASAGLTLACWIIFLFIIAALHPLQAASGVNGSPASSLFSKQTPDSLVHEIGRTYSSRSYKTSEIEQIKDTLLDSCDRMEPKACVEYLQNALKDAQKAPREN